MTSAAPRALIAEDEPLLARGLERMLRDAWPELQVVVRAEDGPAAAEGALRELPHVLFLDIQMPGTSGLEVAAEVVDEWPDDRPLPLLVFVTAFDRYAVEAFERAAVDYLLKPVTAERIRATVARLQQRLAAAGVAPRGSGAALLERVWQAADRRHAAGPHDPAVCPGPGVGPPPASAAPEERIRVIRAASGTRVRLIPLAEVVCFEAADALVRLSLRELAARIEGVDFVQIHRSMLVNAERMLGAERDEAGHYWLAVRGLTRPLKVSRAFSHLFRPM
jgi:DNA-binding LytR/AlgR family response regulator